MSWLHLTNRDCWVLRSPKYFDFLFVPGQEVKMRYPYSYVNGGADFCMDCREAIQEKTKELVVLLALFHTHINSHMTLHCEGRVSDSGRQKISPQTAHSHSLAAVQLSYSPAEIFNLVPCRDEGINISCNSHRQFAYPKVTAHFGSDTAGRGRRWQDTATKRRQQV